MTLMYTVKEIFYSLQGEGLHTGRATVFCRFAGCNLWSGREIDRNQAVCSFCDTDFVGTDGVGGGKFTSAHTLAAAIATTWSAGEHPYVVCTGGEPLLQLDESLCDALHQRGFTIGVETNGTLPAPKEIDWLCVSPKAHAPLRLSRGDELKLVFPQPAISPEHFGHLEFTYFFLQPLANRQWERNTQLALRYCLTHPQWRLSLQTHKLLGIR
ncbi:MAG: 7-carboxy-7-deazaguanine synthase [Beggiatoa sp. IS2]|nr:MAG: 7-carboxy-7-deazaguanine synthase [Beggiatoa sp. IS2]